MSERVGEAPGRWGSSDEVLGLRTPADMRALHPDHAIHPAGVGTAAEFMTRDLLRHIPNDWICIVDDRRWHAAPNGAAYGVIVRAEPGSDAWWVHGWCPSDAPGYPTTGVEIELPRYGFTAAAADAIIALLRGIGVLTAPGAATAPHTPQDPTRTPSPPR